MTTDKSVAEKLLSQEIMDQVSKQGAINALEAVYSKARYARFTRVKWSGDFYDGLLFDDGSTISVYPASFNKLTLIAAKSGEAVSA
ncbi:hypothetical protein C9J03_12860 [Photobacterium gaetbulicola]|uniref:Uncharacterized protein n=2 Tax=Photobacterium gaetbulicola TaxID=1295392 RepID=A0A0C5W9V7_9GAMM|nr:hypothetical protein [Photobacterium gaetbulicola]AJR08331.1 hypothetical protein H744_2c1658 [Photobacterium gaetbulicola Gung47]KHT63304.1 hypothetical protein RJ45_12955 [Photobacterium gaetbulicola]PSU08995.1 hypothetical protein C9J03_12860 [Photobacterium gaetbulicola]